jgi:hypothetical protein
MNTPVTTQQIKHSCKNQFQGPITRYCDNSFVLRHPEEIIQVKSVGQEEQCLQVRRAFLDRTVRNLNEHVQGSAAKLVFDLGEAGISDWEDRKTKRVIILAVMRGERTHHGTS